MKKSNIYLICLLSLAFLFVAGSNLVLKAEYEKIDQNDIYHGYKKEKLKPFKYLKINGKKVGVTQIQPGPDFEIRYNVERKMLDWKITGDTLELIHKRTLDEGTDPYYTFDSKPAIYVMAPQIAGIDVTDAVNILKGWNSENFNLKQKGNSTLLTDNTINNLSANLNSGGYLLINGKNKIRKSDIILKDSSELSSEKDIFSSFQVSADSLAKVKLPGSLYNKLNL